MEKKKLGRLGLLLQDDDAFLAMALDIPSQYDKDGVRPIKKRLRPYNLVRAYRAMGFPMDEGRMYRMMQARSEGNRCGVRTIKAAIEATNVLNSVYGIFVKYQSLL